MNREILKQKAESVEAVHIHTHTHTYSLKEGRQKGITLVALVITIIILLILAGITTKTLVGENGILTKATNSLEESKKSQYKELIDIIIMEKQIERTKNQEQDEPFIKVVAEEIEKKEWVKNVVMCDETENTQIEPQECNKIIVKTKDGYEIIVNINNEEITGEVITINKGEAVKYIVRFDANGGSGEVPKTIEKRAGFSTILPEGQDLKQDEKKIVGWSEDPEAKDKDVGIYACGSTYQLTKEETIFYAVWAEDTVNITFDKNTGEGEMESITIGVNKTTILPNNTFTKYGYRLKEWNTEARRKWNKICKLRKNKSKSRYNFICYLGRSNNCNTKCK